MKAKKWVILFTLAIVLCVLFIPAVNYIVDPFGYFRAQGGEYKELNEDYYLREIKAEHIRNFPDDYDAYLIGGSKAGAIQTEKLKELDGYNYYNCWQLSGNFQDYYYYTKFILEHAKPKKILLHLSTTELKSNDREMYGDIYQIPAQVKGESKVTEVFDFLYKNLSASVDELKKDRSEYYPCSRTGERNLTKYYNYYEEHLNDPDTYYDFLFKKEVNRYLPYLTEGVPDKSEVIESCLNDLKAIKQMCDEKGVELQVICGAAFVGELVRYEGPNLYDFMENLVQITGGVWTFNDVNNLSCNLYNFYNATHYYYEIGDLMIDTITGKKKVDGFGVYLTMNNIGPYIKERKAKWETVKQYYEQNGKLPYTCADSEYNIEKYHIQNTK